MVRKIHGLTLTFKEVSVDGARLMWPDTENLTGGSSSPKNNTREKTKLIDMLLKNCRNTEVYARMAGPSFLGLERENIFSRFWVSIFISSIQSLSRSVLGVVNIQNELRSVILRFWALVITKSRRFRESNK